jgi:DNA-binding PadR family transcriptional regulator
MAILEILSEKKEGELPLIIGRQYEKGDLEYRLKMTLSDEEKSFIGKVIEEMKVDKLIRPTYKHLSNPEKWVEITEAGRRALERRAIDDLDEALRVITPKLGDIRQELHYISTLETLDAIRQISRSAREVIEEVFNYLAPVEEMRAEPDFQPSKEAFSGITRRMRIQYSLKKRPSGFSDSDLKLVNNFCERIDSIYNKSLEGVLRPAHQLQKDIGDLMALIETVLRKLLF